MTIKLIALEVNNLYCLTREKICTKKLFQKIINLQGTHLSLDKKFKE